MVGGTQPPHMITTDTTLAQLVIARDAAHSAWGAAEAAYAATPNWETIAAIGTAYAAYDAARDAVFFATFAR